MRLGVTAALVDGALLPGDVALEDGVVTGLGLRRGRSAAGIATPGFVDLQVNGFSGVDLQAADAAAFDAVGEALLRAGTTAYQPTFITAPEEQLVAALRSLPACPAGARILGAHLDGPFIAPTRLGVHDAAGRRDPDAALLDRLLRAGPVRQMTLAPELAGAPAMIAALRARGVTVSCGHSEASAADAQRAFDAGARSVTHLFNAMPKQGGLAAAALARADVTVQLIVDGHHVPDERVREVWRAAAGRLALVSDAVAAAGMGDGEFLLGGIRVHSRGGVVRRADGVLAGSTLTLRDAVANLTALGVPLAQALTAATAVPARLAGVPRLGRLAAGEPADVLVLDDRLEVVRVITGGRGRRVRV
jgi:N-acetylglucosamine-6-phosphate deacetylase